MEELSRGAEAVVYRDGDTVVKDRVAKRYRHPALDGKLRTERTRREARILQKLPVPGPELRSVDGARIEMSFLPGRQVKELLDSRVELARAIGERVAALHDADLIHGDLTTSNMIENERGLHLIDFGLGFTSHNAEDKAVDLHLFKQALESKHHAVHERAYREFLKGYAASPTADAVLERLKTVERRGRNKAKY